MKLAEVKELKASGKLKEAIIWLHAFESQHSNDNATMKIVNKLLAETYVDVDDVPEGERYYAKLAEDYPDDAVVYSALEMLVREQGRFSECRPLLDHINKILPSIDGQIKTSRAMLDLSEGKLQEGFAGYENRFSFKALKEAYSKELFPRWNGKDSLEGKTVLIRSEQGLGDVIQFVRYARQFKEAGASSVTVQCKQTLHRLVKTVPGVDEVILNVTDSDTFDYEAMIMSGPALFKVSTDKDISGAPYMFAESDIWAKKINGSKLKVGLVWSGDLKLDLGADGIRMNLRRSVPLEMFRPLLDADCDFYSLQKGQTQSHLKSFQGLRKIHDLMDDVTDFYDTACLISNLDLVIAVDTSTAHLAGALGKPVWMLHRLDGDWRWFLNRSDSPWYDSMKIYRQTIYKDWYTVIKQIASDLKNLAKSKS